MDGPSALQITGAFVAGGLAFGGALAGGLRLLPDVRQLVASSRGRAAGLKEATEPGGRGWGLTRESEIVSVGESGLIRYADGFGRGWEASPLNSRFSPDHYLENATDHLARALEGVDVPNAVIQVRVSKGHDPGRALFERERFASPAGCPSALQLQRIKRDYHLDLAARGAYHQTRVTVWARVPVELPHSVTRTGRKRDRNRINLDEKRARQKAESVFRSLKAALPLELADYDGDRVWRELYLSHHEDSAEAPHYTRSAAVRANSLLAGDTITLTNDRALYDGRTPVTVLSMIVPPNPQIVASANRLLERADLGFRHTYVINYITMSQEKAVRILDRRIREVKRAQDSPEKEQILKELRSLRADVVGGREKIALAQYHVLVYGDPLSDTSNEAQREQSLQQLEERCEVLLRTLKGLAGAEVVRENQATLEYLYPKLVAGELQPTETGRERMETCSTLAALAPVEGHWAGSPRPHTVIATKRGQLIGISLRDRNLVMSPTGFVIGGAGSGKSVIAGELTTDFIASNDAAAYVIDVGFSQAPLVRILGGQHVLFKDRDGEPRPLNIWYYPGLYEAQPPDMAQKALVVGDALHLAEVEDADRKRSRNVLHIAVDEVYKNEIHRNVPGVREHEPTLSHLVDMLDDYDWEPDLKPCAVNLGAALRRWVGHEWLDRETHPTLRRFGARLVVFEMSSLDRLDQSVKDSMAYRVSARLGMTGGVRRADGTVQPVLVFIDEGHKVRKHYPKIYEAQNEISRCGRKENQFLLIASQAWEDFADTPDITANSSFKIIGRQNGDFTKMARELDLAPETRAAIGALTSSPGNFAQFVTVIGSGHDQKIEELQSELAPAELWIRTTMPEETDARERVERLRPDWTYPQVIAYLAASYPVGLIAAGLTEIDERPLRRQAA